MNLEQQVMPDLGIFARAGIADGNVEPYEFADIDRTVRREYRSLAPLGYGRAILLALPAC